MSLPRSTVVIATCLLALCTTGCELTYRAVGGTGSSASSAGSSAAADSMRSWDPSSVPSCGDSAGCLSVLTFNTKHRDVPIQLDAVAAAMRTDLSPLPDFILLQEVVFGRPEGKRHDDTAAALAEALGLEARATPRAGGLEGIAILSRHPFDHYDALQLTTRDGLLSGGFPRVSIMGEFRVRDLGRVRVVNVHLAHRPSRHDIRRAQLEETLTWMAARQREAPADVVVIGGDFNIEPGWAELSPLRDLAASGGPSYGDFNSAAPTSGKAGAPTRRVDYIFVAGHGRAVGSIGEAALWPDGVPTRDGSTRFWPSDHLPLLHVFSIAPADA